MDEEKYQHVIKLLKSAPRIVARGDFEKRLAAKLGQIETSNRMQIKSRTSVSGIAVNFYANIRSYFVPAIAVITVILISLFVYYTYFITDDQYINQDLTVKTEREKNVKFNDSLPVQKPQEILTYNEMTVSNQSDKVNINTEKKIKITGNEESGADVTDNTAGPLFMPATETYPGRSDEIMPKVNEKVSSEKIMSREYNVRDTNKLLPATAFISNKKSKRDSLESKINTPDSLEIKNQQNKEK